MSKISRPFSVVQKATVALAFATWLLLSGWAGECDRQDALAYQQVQSDIVASAQSWAVVK